MPDGDDILRKVGTKLADLFFDTDQTRPAEKHGNNPDAPIGDGIDLSRDAFERHLQTILRQDQPTLPLAGRVNFIGLSKIRERLGEKWGHVAERADGITRRAIERRLTSVDVYTRYKQLQYLIIFAQLPKEQAQLKCALIAEEITKRLLGEDLGPELLEVKTMVSPLGGDLAFEEVPSIDVLAARLAEEDTETRETTSASDVDSDEDNWWEASKDAATDPLDGIQFVYRPVWDVRHRAITTYICVPTRQGLSESQMSPLTNPALVRRLDATVQRHVITDLRKIMKNKRRMLLGLPVHFETLASTISRGAYVDVCKRGIPPEGWRLLAFELTGVPNGLPQSRLLELTAILRPFSRGILLRTSVRQTLFRPSTETGIAAVGFEVAAESVPESRQIQDAERFAAAARRAGLASYVHGLRTISFTTAAIAAGLDFVDGDVVTTAVDRPQSVYSFELSNLFRTRIRTLA